MRPHSIIPVFASVMLFPALAGASTGWAPADAPGPVMAPDAWVSHPGDGTNSASPRGVARSAKSWRFQTIDPEGTHPTLQVGPGGLTHVAYYLPRTGTLRYAVRDHGPWVTEPVDRSQAPVTGQFLAVDASGVPHVVYQRDDDLLYATRGADGWNAEVIAHMPGYFGQTALVLNGSGDPFVFFVQDDQVSWMHRTSGGWTAPELLSVYFPKLYSIAIDDADDDLFLTSDDDSDLRYGARHAGVWRFPPPPARYGFLIVSVDSRGEPAIAISLDQGVCVGREQAGGWQLDVVDPAGGDPATLSFDNADRMHLVYHRAQGLAYAQGRPGRWSIDAIADVSGPAYMDLGPGGLPRIAYEGSGVQYATRVGDPAPASLAPADLVAEARPAEGALPGPVFKAWPLPCRDALDVSFAIPSEEMGGGASLGLFDINGRRVRSLATASPGSGAHVVHWDGRNDGGSPAPAGIYFLRLATATTVRELKITRVP